MEFSISLSHSDIEALRSEQTRVLPSVKIAIRIGFVFIALIILSFAYLEWLHDGITSRIWTELVVLGIFALLLPWIHLFVMPSGVTGMLLEGRDKIFIPRQYRVDEQGIQVTLQEKAEHHIWAQMYGWSETKTHFFVFVQQKFVHIFPKNQLSDEMQSSVRDMLTTKLKRLGV